MRAWLLRLWDSGAESVLVNGSEIAKLATMTVHSALRQRLYVSNQYLNERPFYNRMVNGGLLYGMAE